MPPKQHAAPSPRTRARRLSEKAAYDRATIEAILDAMPVAHVGHLIDDITSFLIRWLPSYVRDNRAALTVATTADTAAASVRSSSARESATTS